MAQTSQWILNRRSHSLLLIISTEMIRLIVRMANKLVFFLFLFFYWSNDYFFKTSVFFPEHVPPRSVSCSERLWLGHETLTLAKKLRMDFLRTGKETKRHRKRHKDKHTVYHKHTHTHTLPSVLLASSLVNRTLASLLCA